MFGRLQPDSQHTAIQWHLRLRTDGNVLFNGYELEHYQRQLVPWRCSELRPWLGP